MQSATSDVNAGVLEYRRMLVIAIDRQNLTNAETAISALIGILPSDLKPRFNDEAYRQQTTDVYLITCPTCKAEVQVRDADIRVRMKSGGMGVWNHVDPRLVSSEQYITCPEKKKDKVCGAAIVLHWDDITIVPASDAMAAAAEAGGGGKGEMSHAIVFAPERPRIQSLNDQMLRGPEYWTWVRVVAGILENQLREFRASVSVPEEEAAA